MHLVWQAREKEEPGDRSKSRQLRLSLGLVTAASLNIVDRHSPNLAHRYCEIGYKGVCGSKAEDSLSLTLRTGDRRTVQPLLPGPQQPKILLLVDIITTLIQWWCLVNLFTEKKWRDSYLPWACRHCHMGYDLCGLFGSVGWSRSGHNSRSNILSGS